MRILRAIYSTGFELGQFRTCFLTGYAHGAYFSRAISLSPPKINVLRCRHVSRRAMCVNQIFFECVLIGFGQFWEFEFARRLCWYAANIGHGSHWTIGWK